MANSVDPDQTAPLGAVYSGSMLFASILNSSVMLGNYLQLTTPEDIFRCIFFLGPLRAKYQGFHQKMLHTKYQTFRPCGLFDFFFTSHQQFFSYKGKGLPGLNQY